MQKQQQDVLAGLAVLGAMSGNQPLGKNQRRSKQRKAAGKDAEAILCHGMAHDGTKVESAKGRIVGHGKDRFQITCSDGYNIGTHGLQRLYEIQVACQHGIDALKAKKATTVVADEA